ncbi:MAG: hypothetical protein M3416_01415 [Acidobacteriota bacterium]|nr:hypothetical protein [Acidobacteriota bacterium]
MKQNNLKRATFECPVCGRRQKGYFNRCPNGCQERALREIIEHGKAREARGK